MFQRSWTTVAASLAAAVSFVAAPGCRPAKPAEAEGVVPELKLEGVRFRVYRGEVLRAFGEASTASLRRDSSDLTARDVEAILPRDPTSVRITAPVGQGVLASRAFSASGGVALTRGDDVARTPRARYVPAEGSSGLVIGEDPVVVEGKGYRLDGIGFTLDPAKGEIAVERDARLVAGVGGHR